MDAEKEKQDDLDCSNGEGKFVNDLQQAETQVDLDSHLDEILDRKFDIHIVPWLFGIWLFAFIDRSNIGNAKIDGLVEDLGIATGTSYNLALLVFYIPYILVDVPSNWVIKYVKAGTYLPTLITAWGVVSTCLGFTKSLGGLIAARLFLGAFEGGLLGGIVVYLAMFYRRHQMLRRVGYFYCAAPLSGAFGGLLATGLARIRHGGYDRWPWIFFSTFDRRRLPRSAIPFRSSPSSCFSNVGVLLVEGIMTTLFGILCFFTMPHTPADAKFLTDEERKRAWARMRLDSHGATESGDVNEEHFDWHWVRMAFRAPQTWFCCFIWLLLLIPLYSFSLFLPSIISGLGYQSTTAQLFTVPPNMAGFFFVLGTSFLSDKIKARGPIMAVGLLVAVVGYVMLLATTQNSVRYGGTFLVAIGVFPGSAMIMGWMSNNLAPHYVRATGVGFLIAFANNAAFPATFIYLSKDAPRYVLGHSVCIGALVLCFLTVCAQMVYCRWENKKRESGQRDDRLGQGNLHRLGHRHPEFRYTL